MKPWKTLATSGNLVLQQRDTEFAIRTGGQLLMSSRSTGSEKTMAEAAVKARAIRRMLIGGLGMGYTLRAALDVLPSEARVTVAEISKDVVEWNRGVLADLAAKPLEDPRVTVLPVDVRKAYKQGPFDAILLDVDNGPSAMTEGNEGLYDDLGVAQARSGLARSGVLVVWSAGPDARFFRRLENAGFEVKTVVLGRHVLFIGQI